MDPLEETRNTTDGAGAAPGEVTLVKGRHRWRFLYEPGQEPEVFAYAAAITERPSSGLDHFDLAILAYRLGLSAGAQPDQPFL